MSLCSLHTLNQAANYSLAFRLKPMENWEMHYWIPTYICRPLRRQLQAIRQIFTRDVGLS